jgi:hypothetical protein
MKVLISFLAIYQRPIYEYGKQEPIDVALSEHPMASIQIYHGDDVLQTETGLTTDEIADISKIMDRIRDRMEKKYEPISKVGGI